MKIQLSILQLSLLFCLLFTANQISGQCPVSNFSVASPVCSGSSLQITNNSSNAVSYEWDFAPGFFSRPPVLITDTVLNLNYPGDITLVKDNDTVMIFISGLANGNLYRMIYGNGPGSPVTQVTNFGNLGALYQPSDVAFYKEGGNWYGFVVDYGSNYLYRINFGNSLQNAPIGITPVLTNVTSNFNAPWSIKLMSDSLGDIYGLVCNHAGGSISAMSFGNSILNTPSVNAPVIVPGTSNCQDAAVVKSCGNWYAFLAGNASTKIIRAEFGNSLLNAPSFTTIISDGSPSDIVLINDSSEWKLLYTNFFSYETKRYNLGSDLSNITPVYLGSDHFSGSNPKGICATREGNQTFVYKLYSSNNVQTVAYSNNTQVNQIQSTDSVPQNILFSNPGTYPITLKAYDAYGNFDSYTSSVTIQSAPVTNFNSTGKCFGDSTIFIDSSTVSSGWISSWNWDFGDGDSAIGQNTGHTYSTPGNYNVSLVATSLFGCTDTLIKTIHVGEIPVANFTYPPAVCSLTDIQFTDQSSLTGDTITQWNWNFGNGDSSISQHPNYSFPQGGTFVVQLTVSSTSGCMNSISDTLILADRPQAGFSTTNTCIGQSAQFSDQTILSNSSITNYFWLFGDGGSDTIANPQHVYPASVATYFARLIVIAANGCRDTSLQVVKINNIPTASFSFNPSSGCENNDVFFTDLSTVSGDTISAWSWDFGDSQFDSVRNPTHQYAVAGQYTVTLTPYSPSSCPGTPVQQVLQIKESPTASFNYSTTCDGTSMHFTNNSIPVSGSTIASVSWSFSGLGSSNIYSPDYLFPAAGFYNVNLTVVSSDGCLGIDSLNVLVHDNPVSGFTNSLPCTNDTVAFTNTSTVAAGSSITQYQWNFGDFSSGVNNTSSLQNPEHFYVTSQGYLTSLISTTNYGCKDTVFSTIQVNQTPAASFSYTPTCKGSIMSFINQGSPIDSIYFWDFGDSLTNQIREPAHYYTNDGTYLVSLTVATNAGCSATATQNVIVDAIPAADFLTTAACVNTPYQFTDNSTINAGSVVSWNWTITGQVAPDTIPFPSYLFTDTGSYNVNLTVRSDAGCVHSRTKTITVHGLPESNFTFDPQFGNPPLDVQFTNNSSGGNSYLWDFGDGSTTDNSISPTHTYADTGKFVITQYLTSMFGCIDSLKKNIYVIKPVLDIAVTGDSSYFENNFFNIVCKLKNLGTREITNVQLEAELENGNTIREQLTEVLPNGPLGYKTYEFHASFLVNSANEFNFYCIRAINPNDGNDDFPDNNERCINLTNGTITMDPFPNPFTENITFKLLLNSIDDVRIDLIDASGRIVNEIYSGKPSKTYMEVKTSLPQIQPGIYYCRIIYRDQVIMRRVVKSKVN